MEENKTVKPTQEVKKKKWKTSSIVWTIIGTIVIVGGLSLFLFSRQIFGDEIGDSVLGKDVANGFVAIGKFFVENAAKLIASLVTAGILFIVAFLLKLLLNIIFRKTARAKTIGSLLKSLNKYLFVVIGICSILAIWGVNVYGIFAGLGVLGLIIGLGCKSLVNDIVSGFFIVVDNYFQVGERVVIDGFMGVIDTIGLRTTKIRSWDDNIKCINNSLITTVENLSRYGSKIIAKINVSYNEDLKRVEGIILKNLGKLSERIPELTGPITYAGVNALNEFGVNLIFIADVGEFDRIPTNRKVLRELYLLLKENNVIVPRKQVVLNQAEPVDRPKANEEELGFTNKHFYSKKEPEPVKKKVSIKESFNNAIKDSQKED